MASPRVELVRNTEGDHEFRILNRKGAVIATSVGFDSKVRLRNALRTVLQMPPWAPVEDLTDQKPEQPVKAAPAKAPAAAAKKAAPAQAKSEAPARSEAPPKKAAPVKKASAAGAKKAAPAKASAAGAKKAAPAKKASEGAARKSGSADKPRT